MSLLVLAVVAARTWLAFPVQVASASMAPTLLEGDVVLVSRAAPEVDELQRGDLVTFRSPLDGRRALKRVVGLPGDVLVIRDSVLYVDDNPVEEPYVDHALIDGYYSRTYTVPAGTVFLLGDNRGNSVDSRDYGPVDEDRLLGTVLQRVWPVLRAAPEPRPPKP
jgi:signal peptidase I